MSVSQRDPFVMVAATLNAAHHEDYKSSYLEVYFSICSRAGTSPLQDNFCTCFPSIDSIAEKFRHSRQTVIEATAWLEASGYLFKEKRRRDSNVYTIVLRRQQFLHTWKAAGRDRAKDEYQAWIRDQQAAARVKRRASDSRTSTTGAQVEESSGYDFKSDAVGQEVLPTGTSRPRSEKSQPLHHDLDPLKTVTTPKDPNDLEPELGLGPFSRRKDFD